MGEKLEGNRSSSNFFMKDNQENCPKVYLFTLHLINPTRNFTNIYVRILEFHFYKSGAKIGDGQITFEKAER